MKKRILALIFVLAMMLSAFSVAASAKTIKTIKNVNDAFNFLMNGDGLITIKKASLYEGNKKVSNVYVVALLGSNMSWDKQYINCMQTCIRSGLSLDNVYLQTVKEDMLKKIPKNAKVCFIGHSLGGMVSQQLAADSDIKERYEIINVLTMGSPFIVLKDREGDLHRMADSGDAVPYFSNAGLANFFLGNFSYETNGYFGDPDNAHNVSYGKADKFSSYDALGIKDGGHKLVIK